MTYLWVALGGALGSIGRFYIASGMARLTGPQFPWGTIIINVVGSFVIGLIVTLTAPGGRFAASPDVRVFLMVGFCGGFTTFSSFSLQTLELLREGRAGAALINVALSVVVCVLAVAVGYWAGLALAARHMLGRPG